MELVSIAKRLAAASAAVFVAIHFVPMGKRTNPAVHAERKVENHLKLTPGVQQLMRMDCHSTETEWPWYSRVALVSWMIVRHVERGRQALNFSEWSEVAGRRPDIAASMLAAACFSAKTGRMPRFPYAILNRDADFVEGRARAVLMIEHRCTKFAVVPVVPAAARR